MTLYSGRGDIDIADDSYQDGIYSVHVGAANTLLGYLYIGKYSEGGAITGSSDRDLMAGLGGEGQLFGEGNDDRLFGGEDNDLLDGGSGNDILQGGDGDDTYRFDAGDGVDFIHDTDNIGNNKVIFRAPSGVPYSNSDFDFTRGVFQQQAGGDIVFGGEDFTFTESTSGIDLRIIVSTGTSTSNTVFINDYVFGGDIYTIYRTGYNSLSDGTIVSTQPSELA